MIETGILQLMWADPAVSALVGKRVFYGEIPEGATMPAACFYVITGNSEFTLDGPDPLTGTRYQFDAYAAERFQARTLVKAMRNALEGFTGPLPDGTVVQSAIHQVDGDLPREVGPGGNGFVFRSFVDIEVAYVP